MTYLSWLRNPINDLALVGATFPLLRHLAADGINLAVNVGGHLGF